jgi:Mrp family chromosome partitioning ATPase
MMSNAELMVATVPRPDDATASPAAGELPTDWELRLHPDLHVGSETLDACRTLRANLAPGQLEAALPPLMMVGAANDLACARAAAGLGLVLAEERRSTLIVDASLRQPLAHKLFSIDAAPGFAEAMEGLRPLATPTRVAPFLWLLPAGHASRNPGELLRLSSSAALIDRLAHQYGAVVYLVPSDAAYPDALLLAAHVPAAVLMVRRGVDSVEEMRRLKDSLERVGAQLLGFTLLDRVASSWSPRPSRQARQTG